MDVISKTSSRKLIWTKLRVQKNSPIFKIAGAKAPLAPVDPLADKGLEAKVTHNGWFINNNK